MKLNFFSIIVLSFLIISCEKQEGNLPPRDFEILQLGGHFHDKIFIRWSESIDPENSEITYDILISEKGNDYQIIEKSISRFDFNSNGIFIRPDSSQMYYIEKPSSEFVYSYSLINLEHNTKYSIKIVAKDQDDQKNEKLLEVSTKYFPPLPNFVGIWKGEYNGFWRNNHWGNIEKISGNFTFEILRNSDFKTYSIETDIEKFSNSVGFFDPQTLDLKIIGVHFPAASAVRYLDTIAGNFSKGINRIEGEMKYKNNKTGAWFAIKQ